jgi:HEAT repeat protein
MPCCGACRLEPAAPGSTAAPPPTTATQSGPIKLEGADRIAVLFRIVDRQVERIRTYSEDCQLDAGGTAVHWLQDVRGADSVSLLASLIDAQPASKSRVTNAALMAISQHAEPSAPRVIERLARAHAASAVRGEALFWLAQMAGEKVAGTITAAIENDPDTDVKRRAVFALSQLPKSEGVPLLIDVARRNANPAVRKQAMFWLGQSKDPRAIEFFAEILK